MVSITILKHCLDFRGGGGDCSFWSENSLLWNKCLFSWKILESLETGNSCGFFSAPALPSLVNKTRTKALSLKMWQHTPYISTNLSHMKKWRDKQNTVPSFMERKQNFMTFSLIRYLQQNVPIEYLRNYWWKNNEANIFTRYCI